MTRHAQHRDRREGCHDDGREALAATTDSLASALPNTRVVTGDADISPGQNWKSELDGALARDDALLVLVGAGDSWLRSPSWSTKWWPPASGESP